MDKISIRWSLICSYLLMLIGVLILAGIAITINLNNKSVAEFVSTTLVERYTRTRTTANLAYEINALISQIDAQKRMSGESYAKINSLAQDMKVAADKLQMTRYPKEIGAVKVASAEFLRCLDVYLSKVQSNDFAGALEVHNDQMMQYFVAVTENILKVNGYQIKVANESVSHLTSISSIVIISVTTAIEFVLALIVVFVMARMLRRSISEIVDETNKLADGNLNHVVKLNCRYEFRPILRALEQMRCAWSEHISSLVHAVDTISNSLKEINHATDEINHGAKDNQTRAVSASSSSAEMVDATSLIAKNCENASHNAAQSSQTTKEGLATINEAIAMLNSQAVKSKEDAKLVRALAEQAQQIGTIVSTIDEIASQTNLLALNAAIEAARAGEAGRGFAVVADEVRSLSLRTSESTQEITNMVKSIQEDSKHADAVMQDSVEKMEELARSSEHLTSILSTVNEKVDEVEGQISQIATAAEEQRCTTEGISENMRNISESSDKLAHEISVVTKHVEGTNNVLVNLHKVISAFKI